MRSAWKSPWTFVPWALVAAGAVLPLAGCAAEQRAARIAAASARADASTRVTSTRLVSDAAAPVHVGTPGALADAAGQRAARRPINATCPVMLGNPVDARLTSEWKGVVVAFSDAAAKSAWDADPTRYAPNLPRMSGSSSGGVGSGSWGAASGPVAAAQAATPSVPAASLTAVRRRTAPSAARVVSALPKGPAPTGPAIGSPDGTVAQLAPLAPLAPAATAGAGIGSPDRVVVLEPVRRAPARVAAPAPAPLPARVAAPARPAVALPPPVAPALDPAHGEECDDCPGGVCKIPGT